MTCEGGEEEQMVESISSLPQKDWGHLKPLHQKPVRGCLLMLRDSSGLQAGVLLPAGLSSSTRHWGSLSSRQRWRMDQWQPWSGSLLQALDSAWQCNKFNGTEGNLSSIEHRLHCIRRATQARKRSAIHSAKYSCVCQAERGTCKREVCFLLDAAACVACSGSC